MTLEEYRNKATEKKVQNNMFKIVLRNVLICTIISLLILITCNISYKAKKYINKYLFETNFKFSSITSLYNKYFLDFKKDNIESVSKLSEIEYKSSEKYLDGIKLEIDSNYPIKLLKSGIVVFIGEKENYGNTIIIQQSDGVDAWYGNINANVKLYDYIEKGAIIGESNKFLYLVFQKDGEFQSYNEFE